MRFKCDQKYIICAIIAFSVILETLYIFIPTAVWWDTAIYVGIGKYIFSNGTIGYLETFRPVLWPIVLGALWRVGLNPLLAAKIICVAMSAGTIFLVYRIAEGFKKNAGIFAALMLAVSSVYFTFTVVGITDVPSAFFTVLALYYFLKKKPFFAGIAVGTAFLLRFPQGIMLVPIFTVILIAFIKAKDSRLSILAEAAKIAGGFLLLAIPYLVVNYFLYGNPLLPIITGNQVATISADATNSGSFIFYAVGWLKENPFLVIFAVAFFFAIGKELMSANRKYLSVAMSLVVIGTYYSLISHKELRYSIAFLPFAAIAAGAGMVWLIEKIHYKKILKITTISVSAMIIVIGLTSIFATAPRYALGKASSDYYNFFNDKPNNFILTARR